MTYTIEVATDFNFPNITVYRKYRDGQHYAWRFTSNDGYVMHDTTELSLELDPETFEERYVTYYSTNVDCPLNYDWDNFTWVAVPRAEVDKKYIFD